MPFRQPKPAASRARTAREYRTLSLVLLASAFLLPPTALLSAAPQSRRAAKPKPAAGPLTFEKHVRPLVTKYCVACHAGKTGQGGISLSQYTNAAQVLKG